MQYFVSCHAGKLQVYILLCINLILDSGVDSGGARGARASPEFGGSEKGHSLICTYQSLAITTNTPGFKKLNTALEAHK